MSPLQRLVAEIQQELVRLGKIPAPVRTGCLELNMHQGACASVQPRYYAKIESDKAERVSVN